MKIAVSGATGLVGSAFCKTATDAGHQIIPIVRKKSENPNSIFWDPNTGEIDRNHLAEAEAVVHLAADNIAGGRWNSAKKKRIRDSRVRGTKLISDTLASLEDGPRTFICASAIEFYGSRGNEELTVEDSSGSGFLADVCNDWEAACTSAVDAGIRTVNLRIGVVLSKNGGALQKMLLPFNMGVGGIVGSGKQYWSWIAIDDLADIIQHAVESPDLSGPVNAVAPTASTNLEFTKVLGKVLNRPTIVPMPGFAAKLVLGEMATELLLSSARVKPMKLEASGYTHRFPELEQAFRHVLS